jgi:thiol-disulfide isomerase/thioredoxin
VLTSLNGVTWVARDALPTARATIIAFGAGWCGPCHLAEPALLRVHNYFRAQGVRLVQIREEAPELARAFAVSEPAGIAVASDEHGAAASQFFVFSLPTFVLAGSDGRVSEVIVGVNRDFEAKLKAELTRLLARR